MSVITIDSETEVITPPKAVKARKTLKGSLPGCYALLQVVKTLKGKSVPSQLLIAAVAFVLAFPLVGLDLVLLTCQAMVWLNAKSRKLDRVVARRGLLFPLLGIIVATSIGTASVVSPVASAHEQPAPAAEVAAEPEASADPKAQGGQRQP